MRCYEQVWSRSVWNKSSHYSVRIRPCSRRRRPSQMQHAQPSKHCCTLQLNCNEFNTSNRCHSSSSNLPSRVERCISNKSTSLNLQSSNLCGYVCVCILLLFFIWAGSCKAATWAHTNSRQGRTRLLWNLLHNDTIYWVRVVYTRF